MRLREIQDHEVLRGLYGADEPETIRQRSLVFRVRPSALRCFADDPECPEGALLFDGRLWDAYAKDEQIGARLLDACPALGPEVIFAGLAPHLADHLRASGRLLWETRTHLHVLASPEDARLSAARVGTQPMLPDHAGFASAVWPHGGALGDKAAYLGERIREGPTAAVFEGGRLVAFALTHGDGALGVLHTEPDCRGRGLGRAVLVALVGELLARGAPIFGHVVQGNAVAEHLVASVGLKKVCEAHWVGATAGASRNAEVDGERTRR